MGGFWDDDAMRRAVAVSFALPLLATACALVEPPPPAGTRGVEAQVRNERSLGVELSIMKGLSRRTILGAVQPPSVPARSTGNVTLHIPTTGQWWLAIDGSPTLDRNDLEDLFRPGCAFTLEIFADGSLSTGCEGES